MRELGKSLLGASVFFASSHPSESCGSNGLPLTPHSIKIVGRFQILKTINHPCLCKYISISRGKQERIIVIAEYYKQNLKILPARSAEDVNDIAFQVFQGLAHLNQLKIVHRCLAPDHILIDTDGRVKLSRFGVYHMTDYGTSVSFNIGLPKYTAPEVLLGGPVGNSTGKIINKSAENVDTWSMGIILLEIATGIELWSNLPLRKILERIFSLVKAGIENFSVSALIRGTPLESKYELLTKDLKSLIETCLVLDPLKRMKPADILSLKIFRDFEHQIFETTLDPIEPCFPSDRLRCTDLVIPEEISELPDDLLSERSLEEVYYLWGLAGGDLEAELRRQGMIKIKSPVCSLPKIIIEEGEMFGQKKDRAFLLDETIVELPLLQLRQRLSTIPPVAYFPLIEDFDSKSLTNANHSMNDLAETAKLPLIIREKDIEYQFHRIVLYQRLLLGYPYKRNRIAREARIDVPPLFRGHIWASLLEIDGDIKSEYEHIDKETPTLTDRQIEVDIPRCHQYDELLSSPTGHQKFRRILKAWVISHSQYVYWQGLDSLCAPFLYLNFNDEALAYSCFSVFIDKYLHNFFLKDNSSIIQEYLAVFSHLISFHDPKLSNHLNSIGFIPQLYAIPWFLTMYTHVFPLHKIFHLWDTLLLGNSSFPLCVGVAILQQLRDNLLSFGFNECILLFSDMPEIDIERCVQDSIKIFCSTPKSATYRQYDREESTASENTLAHEIPSKNYGKHPNSELVMDVISFEALTSELNPRISAEELLELLEKDKSNLRSKPLQAKSKLFIVDIRAAEDYFRGAIHDSVNIPFNLAFSAEGNFNPSPEVTSLQMNRGRLVIVVAKNHNHAVQFAEQLVRLEFPRVCILHKGFDILRHANILVVPSINLHSPN